MMYLHNYVNMVVDVIKTLKEKQTITKNRGRIAALRSLTATSPIKIKTPTTQLTSIPKELKNSKSPNNYRSDLRTMLSTIISGISISYIIKKIGLEEV